QEPDHRHLELTGAARWSRPRAWTSAYDGWDYLKVLLPRGGGMGGKSHNRAVCHRGRPARAHRVWMGSPGRWRFFVGHVGHRFPVFSSAPLARELICWSVRTPLKAHTSSIRPGQYSP